MLYGNHFTVHFIRANFCIDIQHKRIDSTGDSVMTSFSPRDDTEKKVTITATISSDMAAAIIGNRGSRVKEIQDDSNTWIDIDPDRKRNDRHITIFGTPKQIQNALLLLPERIRKKICLQTSGRY